MGHEPRDRVRAEAGRLLAAGVSGRVFPGAVACVSWQTESGEQELVEASAGTLESEGPEGDRTPAAPSSRYDLAALTKPIVATAALRLVSRGELDLDALVESVVSDVRGGVLSQRTVRDLFIHRAGLAAWGGLYLDVPHDVGSAAARRWIVSEAARRKSEARSLKSEPSDLGYIIAGECVARSAGSALDAVIEEEVLGPLSLSDEIVYPGALPTDRRAALARLAAPTERCAWRGVLVRGQVQDENAAALGGVAGHSGLFGTANAVARFARGILEVLAGRSEYIPRETLVESLAPPPHGGAVRFGWSLKHGDAPACGRRMSERAFGQLGLTGTSMFCDPESDVAVVLLTNRICPSRANEKIDGFRPAFHDGVMAALEARQVK